MFIASTIIKLLYNSIVKGHIAQNTLVVKSFVVIL